VEFYISVKEEIRISSPTLLGMRSDPDGFGYYGAPRGKHRKHNGTDYICEPGQDIYCPLISGKIVRKAFPYNDREFKGVLIEGKHIAVMLFYVDPWEFLIGEYVNRGDELGMAQDISQKYGGSMKPHIHLTIVSIDPEYLK
jgi:hypothetical protein